MLSNFIVSAVVAQIDLLAFIAILIAVAGAIINLIALKMSARKANQEHEDKFVRQEILTEKLNGMNTQICSIVKEVNELKHDNQREHDQLKKDFNDTVNRIWDWIQKRAK